jgi:RNA polymerase sigma factor (sigma-70 family)
VTRQINKEGRLSDFPSEVRHLWHTRHDEPSQQVFDRLPGWMEEQPSDIDRDIDILRVFPKVLATLGHQEFEVIWYRFWEDFTLEECGDFYGVSKERIRQIEARAIRKLKHPTRHIHFFDLFDRATEQQIKQRYLGKSPRK